MSYMLVLYIYAGVLAQGDSVTLHSIPVANLEVCQREGKRAEVLTNGSAKTYRFVCLKVTP